jgi:hypothetical protein
MWFKAAEKWRREINLAGKWMHVITIDASLSKVDRVVPEVHAPDEPGRVGAMCHRRVSDGTASPQDGLQDGERLEVIRSENSLVDASRLLLCQTTHTVLIYSLTALSTSSRAEAFGLNTEESTVIPPGRMSGPTPVLSTMRCISSWDAAGQPDADELRMTTDLRQHIRVRRVPGKGRQECKLEREGGQPGVKDVGRVRRSTRYRREMHSVCCCRSNGKRDIDEDASYHPEGSAADTVGMELALRV